MALLELPKEKDTFSKALSRGLGGFAAGSQGQGAQFLAGLQEQKQTLSNERLQAAAEDLRRTKAFVDAGQFGEAQELLRNRIGDIQQLGGDASDTFGLLQLVSTSMAGDTNAFNALNTELQTEERIAIDQGFLKAAPIPAGPLSAAGKKQSDIDNRFLTEEQARADKPATQVAFDAMTEGLDEEQKRRAQLVNLGLLPREVGAANKITMVGGVPHRFDPVAGEMFPIKVRGKTVTAETVGEAEAQIADLTKRGEGKGALANKTIDKGFESIGNINSNIRNIDRAIAAIDEGAKTGAIQRFFPNIRASSVKLGQIQRELGLDIVSAVTFGALSKGELDLALDTALPVDLNEAELRVWLEDKKTAQSKLRDYYQKQIEFLDQGGSVPEFLKSQQEQATPDGEDISAMTDEQLQAIASGG